MSQIAGFILILALITMGLVSTGATAVLTALPFELALIGGAAFATLLIGNAPAISWEALRGLALAVTGSRWRRADHAALLAVLHRALTLHRKKGALGLEADLEDPENSALFQAAPRLLKDADARTQLCEALRLMGMGQGGVARVDDQLQRAIDTTHHRRMQAVSALQTVADALPALGIVAAVLGIIKTMTAIDESDAVIGAMIATALLGTFLGVFLAYGLVGPLANRFGQVVEEELGALEVIAVAVSAVASGSPPRVAVETARTSLPPALRPSDADMDGRLHEAAPLHLVRKSAA
ncbi:MAG: MotA/TolQ/ExbB proton channel family protein [Pseudomonadota bacterium]